MALFRGIQEYIALNANNITLVFDSGNIVNISGNIFLYPPQGHPILYKYFHLMSSGQVKNSEQVYLTIYHDIFRTSYLVTGQEKIWLYFPGGQVKILRFFTPEDVLVSE